MELGKDGRGGIGWPIVLDHRDREWCMVRTYCGNIQATLHGNAITLQLKTHPSGVLTHAKALQSGTFERGLEFFIHFPFQFIFRYRQYVVACVILCNTIPAKFDTSELILIK